MVKINYLLKNVILLISMVACLLFNEKALAKAESFPLSGWLQHNLQQVIASPQCEVSAQHLANLVNYSYFYKVAIPKQLRDLYSTTQQQKLKIALHTKVQRILQRFFCNKALVKYSFYMQKAYPVTKQIAFYSGYTTNDNQYIAFTLALGMHHKKWQIDDIMINTSIFSQIIRNQLKTLMDKYSPQQILVVIGA